MSIKTSDIVLDGLVLHIDTGDLKSYKGPPTENRIQSITPNAGSALGFSAITGSRSVYIPKLDLYMTASYVQIYNENTSVCCPSPFTFGTNVPVSGSTAYTYACVYKAQSGYANTNYMYRYEYTSQNGFVLESGVWNNARTMHLGDDWYLAWGSFTTYVNTAKVYLYAFYYRYYSVDKLFFAKVALLKGNFTSIHPTFWPDLNSTRNYTEALIDLVGQNTFDLTNAGYDQRGFMTYNGSSHYVISPENSALNTQTPTVEVWIKTNSTNQNGFWFEKGNVNTQYSLFQEGTVIQWRQNIGGVTNLSTTTANYISTSNWAQVVGTYASGQRKLYINGVLVNSDSQSGAINTNTNGVSIGAYGGYNGSRGYYYDGSLAICRVYNRALSADEVRRNYNVNKSRFGL